MSAPSSVTVHALLRFMERGKGIDVAGIQAELDAIVAEARAAGLTDFSRDGLRFVIKEDKLVTVAPRGFRAQRRQAEQARQRRAHQELRACR